MAIVNRTTDSFWSGNRHGDLASARRALDAAVEARRRHRRRRRGAGRPGGRGGDARAGDRAGRAVPRPRPRGPPRPRAQPRHLALGGGPGGRGRGRASTWSTTPGPVTTATSCTSRRSAAPATSSRTPGACRRAPTRSASPTRPSPSGCSTTPCAPCATGAERAVAAGIPADRVLVDPTLDFGKTTAHSLDPAAAHGVDRRRWATRCCRRCPARTSSARPSTCPPDDRLEGTLAATAVAAWLGRHGLPGARRAGHPAGRRHGGVDPG